MGKALSGELSCPCDRSCYISNGLIFLAFYQKSYLKIYATACAETCLYKIADRVCLVITKPFKCSGIMSIAEQTANQV